MNETTLHQTDQFKLFLQGYYDHLNNYRAFAKALDDLFRRVGPNRRFTRGPLTGSEQQAKELGQVDLITGSPPTAELLELFKEFCEGWALPKRAFFVPPHAGIPDLWFSYMFWAADPEEAPELRVGSINSLDFLEPVQIPAPEHSFEFDPTLMTEKEAKAKVEKQRRAALRKIREAALQAKAMGRMQHMPPYRDEATRALLTGRLFQRVILKTTYGQIAKGPPPLTEGAVKKSVSDLSRQLDVPLPRDPGRPPKPNSG